MTSAQPLLHVWQGLFSVDNESLGVSEVDVTQKLADLEGVYLRLVARHSPPSPPNLNIPGFGACQWPIGECPTHHRTDRSWLWLEDSTGVLYRVSEGTWRVGAVEFPLRAYLNGHLGSVLVFAEASVSANPVSTLAEVESLAATLQEMLQRVRGSQSG